MTRRSSPGGARPYLAATISRSVPHTPTRVVSTRSMPGSSVASGTSSSDKLPAAPGFTVIARTRAPLQRPTHDDTHREAPSERVADEAGFNCQELRGAKDRGWQAPAAAA